MTTRPSYSHVFHLILELRQAALENAEEALAREDGGWGLCLGAALASDAADALEAMLAERGGTGPGAKGQPSVVSIRCGPSGGEERGRPRGAVSPGH